MRTRKLRIDVLKRLDSRYRTARALFQFLSTATDDKQAVENVDRMNARMVAEQRIAITRPQLIYVLRMLQAAGCGKFVHGRRGRPSRFVWAHSPHDIAQAVTGKTARTGAAEKISVMPTPMIEHSYRLRPDVTISVSVPLNITCREAQRLAEFVGTLSFEDGSR
jgi:hypothetical protein